MNLTALLKALKADEGYRDKPYLCSKGRITIGWGHNCEAKPLPPEMAITLKKYGCITEHQADELLAMDALNAYEESMQQPWWRAVEDSDVRAGVMVNMMFQLGLPKLNEFRKMLPAVARKDWVTAAKEGRDSLWFRQSKGRAVRLMREMETGRHA